jgi:predicted Na+-dependent transporter
MLLPIATGMLMAEFLHGFAQAIQPRVATLSNIALYVLARALSRDNRRTSPPSDQRVTPAQQQEAS